MSISDAIARINTKWQVRTFRPSRNGETNRWKVSFSFHADPSDWKIMLSRPGRSEPVDDCHDMRVTALQFVCFSIELLFYRWPHEKPFDPSRFMSPD